MIPGLASAIRGSGGGPPSITYVTTATLSTDLTTYTFSTTSTGVEDSSRKTIVGVNGRDSATIFNVSGVTVGGNAATLVVEAVPSVEAFSAIWIINNPTGTTADIVVTFSEAVQSASVHVWSAYNLNSSTATDTASATHGSANSLDLSLTLEAGGVAVGTSAAQNNDATTWVGLTERIDAAIGDAGRHTAADLTSVAGGAVTISTDHGGTSAVSGCSAAFR